MRIHGRDDGGDGAAYPRVPVRRVVHAERGDPGDPRGSLRDRLPDARRGDRRGAVARVVVILAVDRLHHGVRDVQRREVEQFEGAEAKAHLVFQEASAALMQQLEAIINQSADVFKNQLDHDSKINFKAKAKSFLRVYAYLSRILDFNNLYWEQLWWYLKRLVPKLYIEKTDDLAADILQNIDMDSYRPSKQGTEKIILSPEAGFIEPIPVETRTGKPEPNLDTLENIVKAFNEHFGDIEWTDKDKIRRILIGVLSCYKLHVPSLGLMRIALAIVILLDLIFRCSDIEAFYTAQGIWPKTVVYNFAWSRGYWSFHLIFDTYLWNGILFGFHFLLALLLLLGYRTQLVTAFLWLFTVSLHNRNLFILQSGDDLLRLTLLWAIFLPLICPYFLPILLILSQFLGLST